MKKIILIALACRGLSGMANVQISEETAQQHYPWNGQVDISFNVIRADGVFGHVRLKVKNVYNPFTQVTCETLSFNGRSLTNDG